MRRLRAYLVIAFALVLIGTTSTFALAATRSVGVKKSGSKYRWTPSKLTVKRGTTVKWHWSGKVPHNVTGPGIKSRTATKLTFSHKFTKKGTYRVVCTIHQALGQRMTIVVR